DNLIQNRGHRDDQCGTDSRHRHHGSRPCVCVFTVPDEDASLRPGTDQVPPGTLEVLAGPSEGSSLPAGPGEGRPVPAGPGEGCSVPAGPGEGRPVPAGPGESGSVPAGSGEGCPLPAGPGESGPHGPGQGRPAVLRRSATADRPQFTR